MRAVARLGSSLDYTQNGEKREMIKQRLYMQEPPIGTLLCPSKANGSGQSAARERLLPDIVNSLDLDPCLFQYTECGGLVVPLDADTDPAI